jgi:hypothetical protein
VALFPEQLQRLPPDSARVIAVAPLRLPQGAEQLQGARDMTQRLPVIAVLLAGPRKLA